MQSHEASQWTRPVARIRSAPTEATKVRTAVATISVMCFLDIAGGRSDASAHVRIERLLCQFWMNLGRRKASSPCPLLHKWRRGNVVFCFVCFPRVALPALRDLSWGWLPEPATIQLPDRGRSLPRFVVCRATPLGFQSWLVVQGLRLESLDYWN